MRAWKSAFSILAVSLLGSVSAFSQTSTTPLRVPFPYVFSGPAVDLGEQVWRESILPAQEKINKAGGIKGRSIEFYKVDIRYPDTAAWISEFRRLCADPNVPAIYGVGPTRSLLAIYGDLEKCGIPVFNPGSAGAWPNKDFANWIYRYQPDAEEVIPQLMARAKERLNLKRVAIIGSGGIYSDGPMQPFDHAATYLQAIFGFMGITNTKIIRAEGLALGPDAATQGMANAAAAAAGVVLGLQ